MAVLLRDIIANGLCVVNVKRSESESESKFLPRCQNPQFCGFAPRGKLVGECLPQTLLWRLAPQKYFRPAGRFLRELPRKYLTDQPIFCDKWKEVYSPCRSDTTHPTAAALWKPGCLKMNTPTSQRGLRPMVSASPNFSGRRYGGRSYARLSML